MRYYFTAIQAIYMIKEHGVRLINQNNQEVSFQDLALLLAGEVYPKEDKFYLHPSESELLRLRGDDVIGTNFAGTTPYGRRKFFQLHPSVTGDSMYAGADILERGNVNFIMPKKEENQAQTGHSEVQK